MSINKTRFSLGDYSIDIHFENDDFIIIEKPSGLACHGPDEENLVQLLKTNTLPTFLCHRLDKGTSGLLIIAKSSLIADEFRILFEGNKINKFYLALSNKKGKKKQGAIKGYMAKSRDGTWILSKQNKDSGQTIAVSQFFSFALPKVPNFSIKEPVRVFIIKIINGKTHQIRVALKSNSSPVLGDSLYKGMKYQRMCLHAYALEFSFKGDNFSFLSEVSFLENSLDDFNSSLRNCSTPWLLPWPKI